MARKRRNSDSQLLQPVAGNGLLDRRLLLKSGMVFAGAVTTGVGGIATRAAAEPLAVDPWSKTIGATVPGYSTPSHFEAKVVKTLGDATRPGTQQGRTPHQDIDGIITPNGVHFVVARAGAPDIDPEKHQLLIHGMVKQPLTFSYNDLLRYPMETHVRFIECGGNSAPMWSKTPIQANIQALHGLLSCSEWTGIRLSTLLDEAGIDPKATWMIAEGADGVTMNRSVPVAKAMDDAMIVFYQNGERIMPWNGYPMRLFLPGYEGNMNVKWLRRIKVTAEPTMTKDETSKYSDLQPNGRAKLFTFPMEVKSVITSPSGMQSMREPGLYQISGIAWSGFGRVRRVEISADGGKTFAEAALDGPVLPKALTRFRMPWRWDGSPSVLMSRAVDETGAVQPTRAALMTSRGAQFRYHYNAIQSWNVAQGGAVSNVYV